MLKDCKYSLDTKKFCKMYPPPSLSGKTRMEGAAFLPCHRSAPHQASCGLVRTAKWRQHRAALFWHSRFAFDLHTA